MLPRQQRLSQRAAAFRVLCGFPVAALIALLLGVCVLAAEAAPTTSPRADRDAYASGLLWRIHRPGAPPTYVFGTLHLDDERVTTLAPRVEAALKAARVLVVELLNDEVAVERFRRALTTAEPVLRSQLGPASYARVAKALDEHDVPRRLQPHLTPWAALLTLLQPTEQQRIILDQVLVMAAEARGMPVRALETVDEQLDAFAGLSPGAQIALLEDVAVRQEEIRSAVRPLRDAYLARDLAALARINAAAMGDDPRLRAEQAELLESVLYARNRRFVARIVPYAERGGAFVAFGALHLHGPDGVLAGLAARGYQVRRVW